MTIRASFFGRAAAAALAAAVFLPGLFAAAQQIDMNVVDQPGYQPKPEEEQLSGAYHKQEWPDWRPPPEMIERQPYLPRFMAGGPGNPMGARALYLGQTIYRIHGTNQPQTIGHAISSGCFRLVNDDVTDLYGRVPIGTKVIIRQAVAL